MGASDVNSVVVVSAVLPRKLSGVAGLPLRSLLVGRLTRLSRRTVR